MQYLHKDWTSRLATSLVAGPIVGSALLVCGLSVAFAQQQTILVPKLTAARHARHANEGREALLRLRECGPLQLRLCWDSAGLRGLSEWGV